jgi:hypothetical protein
MTTPSAEASFAVRLPVRHADQRKIADSRAKRKVINAGRRGGKTTLAADISVADYFLNGRKVMYAAPVAKQTDAYWKKCKHYLSAGIRDGYIRKDETRRTLTLGTGEISCQTAHNADTMRSGDADLLIFDEWAFMEYDAWDKVGAPMLLDTNGDAMFISTPNRRNHHFVMFQKGISEGGEWASFIFPSTANPYLKKEAFDLLVADMTEDSYRQEILAEFLEGEGAVFRNIAACMNAPKSTPDQHYGHRIVAGGDWGKLHDFTTVSIGCATCREEVAIDRFNQIDYPYQRARITALLQYWHVTLYMPEENAIGVPIVDELRRDPAMEGISIVAFQTSPSSKPQLIENLALTFEKAEWQFLPDPVWRSELEAYERKVSATTGRSQYSAPEGLHDDTVIGRALMRWAATNAAPMPAQPTKKSTFAPMGDQWDGEGSRWKIG